MRSALRMAAIAAMMTPAIAKAETIGNAAEGERYAKAQCAECHTVDASGEISPDFAAPRFVEVANTPGMTERALGVWLVTSHPTMPDLMIPETVRDNLIAYIMSLRAPTPQ